MTFRCLCFDRGRVGDDLQVPVLWLCKSWCWPSGACVLTALELVTTFGWRFAGIVESRSSHRWWPWHTWRSIPARGCVVRRTTWCLQWCQRTSESATTRDMRWTGRSSSPWWNFLLPSLLLFLLLLLLLLHSSSVLISVVIWQQICKRPSLCVISFQRRNSLFLLLLLLLFSSLLVSDFGSESVGSHYFVGSSEC